MTKSTMAGGRVDSDRSTSATWSTPRKVAFYSVIAVMLVGINAAFWRVHLFPLLAWFPDDFLNRFYTPQLELDGISVGDFAQHRIHYLAISANHWGAVLIPLLLLFRNPITKVAPMWQVTGGLLVGTLTFPFGDVSRIPPPVFAVIPGSSRRAPPPGQHLPYRSPPRRPEDGRNVGGGCDSPHHAGRRQCSTPGDRNLR